jgi:hypothetical protein
MSHKIDDTLRDLNRRDIAFPDYKHDQILPGFFATDYPKLLSLLEEYYHFEDGDDAPSRLVNDLFYSRDITQVDTNLLSYIEDELLLGQSYFEGFANKRDAAKFSNILYRSKGTKFSIQQFFRTFFSIDPDVVYTKNNVFKLNGGADYATVEKEALLDQGVEDYGSLDSDGARTRFDEYIAENYTPLSVIGSNSERFLTDDKLYQTFAVQIKAELPLIDWIEEYKLFAHPAGMYLGSQLQVVSVATDLMVAPEVLPPVSPPVQVIDTAFFGDFAVSDNTSLVNDLIDSSGMLSRIRPELVDINKLNNYGTIQDINNQYGSLREAQIASSPTFDDSDFSTDSATVGFKGMDMSNNFAFETMDQEKHPYYSADSDVYLSNLNAT